MKQILPVVFPLNLGTAIYFNLISINDNLINTCQFYYQMLDSNTLQISNGNLTMTGSEYIAYSTSPDSNMYAYNWGANKLGLTLV